MPVRLCIGDAVLVFSSADYPDNKNQAIGLIRHIGLIKGYGMTEYVGIELIEPVSHGHNGTINDWKYFDTQPGHGIHVKVRNVIKKLTSEEIIMKLKDVIQMFTSKLQEYVTAVEERDCYIDELRCKVKDLTKIVRAPSLYTDHDHETIANQSLNLNESINIETMNQISQFNNNNHSSKSAFNSNANSPEKPKLQLKAYSVLTTIDDGKFCFFFIVFCYCFFFFDNSSYVIQLF